MHHAKAQRRKAGPSGENETARHIVDAAFRVHTTLGPGLLESVYQRVFAFELRQRGRQVATEVPVALRYDTLVIRSAFRADLVVDEVVLVELKSVEQLLPVHKKQVLTYLRLCDLRLGLLINFNAPTLKSGIHRIANGMPAR